MRLLLRARGHRRGLGRQMVMALEERARQLGARLIVRKVDDAIAQGIAQLLQVGCGEGRVDLVQGQPVVVEQERHGQPFFQGVERLAAGDPLNLDVQAIELAAIGVAAYAHRQNMEGFLRRMGDRIGHQDRARANAP